MEERSDIYRQILVQLHEKAVSATEAVGVAQGVIEKLQAENTRLGKENWELEGKLKRSERVIYKLVHEEIPRLELEIADLTKELRILDFIRDADILLAQSDMEAEERK